MPCVGKCQVPVSAGRVGAGRVGARRVGAGGCRMLVGAGCLWVPCAGGCRMPVGAGCLLPVGACLDQGNSKLFILGEFGSIFSDILFTQTARNRTIDIHLSDLTHVRGTFF